MKGSWKIFSSYEINVIQREQDNPPQAKLYLLKLLICVYAECGSVMCNDCFSITTFSREGLEYFLHRVLTSCSWLFIWSSACLASSSLAIMASILSASSRAASCSTLLLSSSSLMALSSCSWSSAGQIEWRIYHTLNRVKKLTTYVHCCILAPMK